MSSTSLRDAPAVASDMMAPHLQTLSPGVSVAYGLATLLKQNRSGMPVVDEAGNYLGVFSEKCCLKAMADTSLFDSWEELPIRATEVKATKLFCLLPEEDSIVAIGGLLKHHFSGAPVADSDRTYRGMFSEKTSMRVLIGAAYESLPSATVSAFMDTDSGRIIDEGTPLATIARMFIVTSFRRLPIVRDGKVVGQVSRGNIIRAKGEMPQSTVADYMDRDARTITESTDLLTIAGIFLNSPYRRLPVVKGSKLVGQVSRRDVLNRAYHLMDPPAESTNRFLYLSALDNEVSERLARK